MNNEYLIAEKSDFTNIAKAIRAKSGTTDSLQLADIPTLIKGLEGLKSLF